MSSYQVCMANQLVLLMKVIWQYVSNCQFGQNKTKQKKNQKDLTNRFKNEVKMQVFCK